MPSSRQRQATSDFVARIRAQQGVPVQKFGKLARAVAGDIGRALIVGSQDGPGTPVDTGWARGNWFATLGDGGGENTGLGDPPTRGDTSQAGALTSAALEVVALAIAGFGPGQVLSYINNAAYIERLNNGWSQQAPAGITDAVVARFNAIVERNALRLGIGQ